MITIVWDGENLVIPSEMGKPNDNQLKGSALDNLAELAGRVCYDSLGKEKSRSSEDYHKHIQEVGHGSVYEHPTLCFRFIAYDERTFTSFLLAMITRPGVHITSIESLHTLRFTINTRSIMEWNQWSKFEKDFAFRLGFEIWKRFRDCAPLSLGNSFWKIKENIQQTSYELQLVNHKYHTENEKWISIYINNISRGLSHELVRHKYQTGVSQRSTRYCDENESEWVVHPLMRKHQPLIAAMERVKTVAQLEYLEVKTGLFASLVSEGYDKPTARKQARGAARGLLGNALATELIFSASLSQWRHMIKLRNHESADAEIREAFSKIEKEINNG